MPEQQFIVMCSVAKKPLARHAQLMQIQSSVGDDSKGDQSMRMLFSGLVVAAAVALSAPAIAASVMSPAGIAGVASDTGVIEQVAHGCGRGWWRGPDAVGRCRPMGGGAVIVPGVVVAPPVVVVPRRRWCHGPHTSNNFRC
jgi:hypothetical protein